MFICNPYLNLICFFFPSYHTHAKFEELRKVGTKLSRAAEIELQKKQQQLEYEATQRKKEDEQARRRKEAETQKLLRMELERKKMEEEHRKREVAAQLRAKERAREREREQLEREKAIERARKQKLNNPNAPTYSASGSSRSSNKPTYSGSASGSRSASSYMDPKASVHVNAKLRGRPPSWPLFIYLIMLSLNCCNLYQNVEWFFLVGTIACLTNVASSSFFFGLK